MKTKLWVIGLLAVMASGTVWACNVPVFRYALERWMPDSYRLILFHQGALSSNETALVNQVLQVTQETGAARPNVQFQTIDVARQTDELLLKTYANELQKGLPRLLLLYPAKVDPFTGEVISTEAGDVGVESAPPCPTCPSGTARGGELAWAGPFAAASVQAVFDSPARRETARRILKGDSIVWVFVESGDRAQDEEAFQRLESELKKLENTWAAATTTAEAAVSPPDNPFIGDVGFVDPNAEPVKIAFSVLRVSRAEPAERVFISQLMRSEAELDQYVNQPMTFPVFGQGRVLYALAGRGINAEHVAEACEFLTGACSCEVKAQNPGTDLLMTADWSAISGDAQVVDAAIPELTGILPTPPPTTGVAVATADGEPVLLGPKGEKVSALSRRQEGPAPKTEQKDAETLNWVSLFATLILVVAVLAASLWLRRRNRE